MESCVQSEPQVAGHRVNVIRECATLDSYRSFVTSYATGRPSALVQHWPGSHFQFIVSPNLLVWLEKFGLIVDFCLSLTNYHIRLHPLRERDIEYYKLMVADLRKKTEEAKNSNRKRQLKHRQRRMR